MPLEIEWVSEEEKGSYRSKGHSTTQSGQQGVETDFTEEGGTNVLKRH